MKSFKPHPYEMFKREHDTAEAYHLRMIAQLTEKKSYEERFKQTPAEKAELKKRMLNYPNKNHKPVSI